MGVIGTGRAGGRERGETLTPDGVQSRQRQQPEKTKAAETAILQQLRGWPSERPGPRSPLHRIQAANRSSPASRHKSPSELSRGRLETRSPFSVSPFEKSHDAGRRAGLGSVPSPPVHQRPLIWGARPSLGAPAHPELQCGRTLLEHTERQGLAYLQLQPVRSLAPDYQSGKLKMNCSAKTEVERTGQNQNSVRNSSPEIHCTSSGFLARKVSQ